MYTSIFDIGNNRSKASNSPSLDYTKLQQAQKQSLNEISNQLKRGLVQYKPYQARPLKETLQAYDAMDEDTLTAQKTTVANPMYYYHPDHLGTSTALTDITGEPYQFFLNLPFCETMAEQLGSHYYNSPYKFNSKELDEETGLYYYGARYYDPKVSNWLSVDPLAEKYPNYTPYAYCANNPIIYVDPDGRDIVYFNTNGAETHRVASTKEFRTFIQSTATIQHPTKSLAGWNEVAMPNIIQERTQTGENVSGASYQANDYIIAARTGLFNQTKNNGLLQLYTEKGDAIPKSEASKIPDLDPTLVKAIAIQESHNGTTGVSDILTANNGGDYDKYKTAYGLIKTETVDVNRSLYLGIRFLATKGFRGGITYDKNTGLKTYNFKGWGNAAGNYNGGGVKGYQGYIEEMKKNATTPRKTD